MANEVQKYTFEGDTSSLAASVRQAITLLGQYASKLEELQKAGKFKGSASSLDAMKNSFKQTTQQLKALYDMLKRVTDVNLKGNSAGMSGMSSALSTLYTSLNNLRNSSNLTEEDMRKMSASLSNVAANFSKVYDSVNNSKVGFTNTAQATKQATQEMKLLGGSVAQSVASGSKASLAWAGLSIVMRQTGTVFSSVGKTIVNASSRIASAGIGATKALLQIASAVGQVASNAVKAAGSSRKLTTSLGGVASVSRLARDALGALGAVSVGKMLADAARESISYVENLNLFNVAMRESIDVGKEYVAQMAEVYGLDPSNIMRHVGLFYQLSAAMEAPQAASEKMSMGLTSLGVDLASIFNMNISQVMDNLVSGTQGMSRAVRKYGLDIRISTLQQEAFLLGIKGQVATMNEASRQGLRYLAMMKQAKALQGDFAKTIESPANQLRVLVEQMKQFGRAVGNFLIGPITAVLPYINGFIMALRMLLNGLSALMGFKPLDFGGSVAGDAEDVVSGIGTAADESSKKLKKMLAPFDELNTISQQAASGGGGSSMSEMMDPRIAAAMEEMQYKMLDIEMKANRVRDAILKFAGLSFTVKGELVYDAGAFEENLKTKWPQWAETISAIFRNWKPIIEGVGLVLNSIFELAKKVSEPLRNMFSGMSVDENVANFIDTLPGKLQAISDWINNNQDTLATTLQVVGAIALAFALWNNFIAPILTFLAPLGALLAGVNPIILIVAAAVAALAGAFLYLYNTNETFKTSVDATVLLLQEKLAPAFQLIQDLAAGAWATLKAVWEKDGKPVFDKLVELIILVGETLQSVWNNVLQPVFETLGATLLTLWTDHIQPTLGKIIALFFEVGEVVLDLIRPFVELVAYVAETWGPLIVTTISWAIEQMGIAFGFIFDVIGVFVDILKGALEFIAGIFTGDWDRAWNGIKTIFSGVFDGIKALFTGSMDAIKLGFNTFKGIFSGVWKGFWDSIFLVFDGIVTKIKDVFGGVMTTVTNAIDTVKNFKMPSIGDIGSGIGDKLKGVGSVIMNLIPKFASGGFPDAGQMFVARESGAELVGNIGGSTAVMNNDQIVAAVSSGVAAAVKAALGGSSKSGEQEYSLVIDSIEFGRVIKKAVNDLQRQTGTAALQL